MFGDGEDQALTPIGQKWISQISTEICFDLHEGIRAKNGWKNGRNKTKLHIVTSNSIDIGEAEYINHLPTDECVVICAVDPDGIVDSTDVDIDPTGNANLTHKALTMICHQVQNPKRHLKRTIPTSVFPKFEEYNPQHIICAAVFDVDVQLDPLQ
jgi:hypothetical protein